MSSGEAASEIRNGNGPLAWMARNGVAANVILVMLVVGGILSVMRVRQEVFPEFDLDMVVVQVTYPGASPAEVERGVILAIEEAVRGLDGVKEVRATASEGNAAITIELMLGANAQKALSDVQSAVGRIASFPEDIERPVVSLATLRSEAISLVVHGDVDERSLRSISERVRDDLLQDPGITTIDLSGVRPLEVIIEAPEERLRAYGLRLSDVANAVTAASVEIPGGGIKTRQGEVLVRTDERRTNAADFAEIVIRSETDGTIVTVGDVATVTDGFREVDLEAYYDGDRAIMLKVFRVGSQTPLAIASAVKTYADEHAVDLPPGVHFAIWNDRSEIYAQRVDLLRRNAIAGLILVMITLALFLEIRLAFWVTLGIPVSFLGTLLLLPSTDVTINMISLFAFILTLGIVVDDAIVVAESVYYHRQQGKRGLAAAVAGVREVATPVAFSVLTTVVAFVPLLGVPGVMGKFFMNIPVIVILVLLISLFESLFILPSHLAHEEGKPRGIFHAIRYVQDAFQRALNWFIDFVYAPVQRFAIFNRYLTLGVGIATLCVVFGLVAGGRVKFTFFPKIDSDIATATVRMPFGTAVEDTRAVQRALLQAGQELAAELGEGTPVLRGTYAVVGSTGAAATGAGDSQELSGSHIAEVALQLVASDERSFTARELTEQWRQRVGSIPGIETMSFQYSVGGPSGAEIDFQLSHPDLNVLETAAGELAQRLAEFPGAQDIDDGFSQGKTQLDLHLRPEARALGITEAELGRQLRNAYYGAEAVREQRGRDEVRVVVRRPREERESLASLEQFLLRTPQGGEIPLAEAAEIERGHAYTKIQRVDGRRIVDVTSEVAFGSNANEIVEQILTDIVPGLETRYPALGISLGGNQQRQAESLGALRSGFLMALIAMYALMAIPFRSYVQPVIIMTAIPFSFIGAIIGHILLGYDLSLMSVMGLVALAGVAVNDSLVYIEATNELYRGGLPAEEAASQAGIRRFRPILLTSLTTFFGLMPMLLETSVQARFLIPMAISLGFGVLFCTVSTLLLVPALYIILFDLARIGTGAYRVVFGSEPEAHEVPSE